MFVRVFGSIRDSFRSCSTMSARIDQNVVHERLSSLIWRCLDNDLIKTAHFYAERLFAVDGANHEARHLLATATLSLNQPHSALHLVTRPRDDQCAGCYEIAAKCSAALGRHSKARSLLEHSIVLSTTSPISASIIIPINHFASLTLRHSLPINPQNHEQHASLPQFQTRLLFTATRVSLLRKLASLLMPSQALHVLSNLNLSCGRHGQVSVRWVGLNNCP